VLNIDQKREESKDYESIVNFFNRLLWL